MERIAFGARELMVCLRGVVRPLLAPLLALVAVLGCSTTEPPPRETVGFVRQAAAVCSGSCPAAPGTCVLCPTADATVYSENGLNDGNVNAMCVGLADTRRALLKFDAGMLPASIDVTSASLVVNAARQRNVSCSTPIATLSLYQITSGDVLEGASEVRDRDGVCGNVGTVGVGSGPCQSVGGVASTSNFANIGGALTASAGPGTFAAGVGSPYTFSGAAVEADVQDWRNNLGTNLGWQLRTTDANGVSIGARNATEYPTLTVQYRRALGQSCSLNSQCGSGLCVDGFCCNAACGATCVGDTCTGNTSDCFACNTGGGANGTCSVRNGLSCGSATNDDCTNPDTCNAGGTCLPNHEPAATGCTDTDGNDCTSALCNGVGGCTQNNNRVLGASCGSSTNDDCTNPDTCNGSGTCLPNHESSVTACTDSDGNDCTSALCNGAGGCVQSNNRTAGAACGSATNTDCTNPDTCNGSGTCLPNHESAATGCADSDGNDCTSALCNGAGACTQSNNKGVGAVCGSTTNDDCTNPDGCNGSGTCLSNHELAGTGCTDSDGNACTSALCNGSGACTQSNNRPAGTSCPADTNPCSLDQCNASGACIHSTPGNAGASCRNASCSGDNLTQAEVCTGSSITCPGPNVIACSGTCSGASCSDCANDTDCGAGRYCQTGACFTKKANSGTCTGNNQCNSSFCVDGVCCESACGATVAGGGACTTSPCSGGATDCQACNNGGQLGLCRSVPLATSCADTDSNVCTFAQCNGTGACTQNNNQPNGTGCGSSTDTECSNPDSCLAGTCRTNDEPTTLACGDTDGNDCTAALCNGGGACAQNNNRAAGAACGSNANTDCTNPDTCNGSGACQPNHDAAGVSCTEADGNPCTAALCNGSGTCAQNNNRPSGTACTDDINPCTVDACNAGGTCTHNGGNLGALCRQSAGVCDVSETCAGAAACPTNAFLSSQCRPASCTSGVATVAASCPGNAAACPTLQTIDCFPFTCQTSACHTTCGSDAQCDADGWCNAPACEPKRVNGQGCGAANQCLSGRCVDGVCCNAACAGQCQACDVPGSIGSCTPVPGGGDPHGSRPACEADNTACDGFCNGVVTASCTYPGASTQCRAPTCTEGEGVLAAVCNGTGNCPSLQTQQCEPYACDATACFGDCQVDAHCVDASYCSAGVCVPKLEQGAACSSDGQCTTEHCIDGVCCDRLCPGQCEACDGPELGLCSPIEGTPHAGRAPCIADPDGSPCDGYCDGTVNTSCTYPGAGTACRGASCEAGTATVGAACNGSGTCPVEIKRACTPFSCGPTQCDGDCDVATDCTPSQFCQAGVCTPKSPNGASCADGNGCSSGICVDGICCNQGCTGQCEACDAPGQEGECVAVSGAPHGTRPGCTGDASSCAGLCDGVERDGCIYPGPATQCRAPDCESGVATLAAQCTGDGRCPTLQVQACHPLACNGAGTLCAGNCTTNANCNDTQFCSGGLCAPKHPNGEQCGADAQCESGECVDGLCCNAACEGQCEACDVAGLEGICSNVPLGLPHGGRPSCGGVGPCTARCTVASSTSCTFPGAEVACGSNSCTEGVETLAPVCNGAGTCLPPSTASCGRYSCGDDDGCLEECVTSEDCAEGFECQADVCVPEIPSGGGSGGNGGAGGTTSSGGTSGGDGTGGDQGSGGDGTGAASGSAGDGATGGASPKPDGGCGCAIPGADTAPAGSRFAALGALALAAALLRRRRRGGR